MSTFKPVELVSPKGEPFTAFSVVTLNNLVSQGYARKNVDSEKSKSAPAVPAAESENPVVESAAPSPATSKRAASK